MPRAAFSTEGKGGEGAKWEKLNAVSDNRGSRGFKPDIRRRRCWSKWIISLSLVSHSESTGLKLKRVFSWNSTSGDSHMQVNKLNCPRKMENMEFANHPRWITLSAPSSYFTWSYIAYFGSFSHFLCCFVFFPLGLGAFRICVVTWVCETSKVNNWTVFELSTTSSSPNIKTNW